MSYPSCIVDSNWWREPSHQQLAVPSGTLAPRIPQGLGHGIGETTDVARLSPPKVAARTSSSGGSVSCRHRGNPTTLVVGRRSNRGDYQVARTDRPFTPRWIKVCTGCIGKDDLAILPGIISRIRLDLTDPTGPISHNNLSRYNVVRRCFSEELLPGRCS